MLELGYVTEVVMIDEVRPHPQSFNFYWLMNNGFVVIC